MSNFTFPDGRIYVSIPIIGHVINFQSCFLQTFL